MQENFISVDVVIVGAGPSGLFAAFQCGMLGLKCAIVESLSSVGGQCAHLYPQKYIYDIPGILKISGGDLSEALYRQAMHFRPEIFLNQEAISLDILDADCEDDDFSRYRFIILSKSSANACAKIQCKAVIIAAGVGSFSPKKLPIAEAEQYEGRSIFYSVADRSAFANKRVVIVGGGDSAIDWAMDLSEIASVSIIHRRNDFSAAGANAEKAANLVDKIWKPYVLESIDGIDGVLQNVVVKNLETQELQSIPTDYLLAFFGLSSSMGSISSWGLDMTKRGKIIVDQYTCESSYKMIFAIGDCADSLRPAKLIVTGFDEGTQAAHAINARLNPGKRIEYSTTKFS